METCCEVTCEKPVMKNSQVGCCEEHEEILKQHLDEEHQRMQKELYDDYVSDVMSSINSALLRNHM